MRKGNIVPCLWFDHQAEEAARFYVDTFGDGRIVNVSHYPESGDNPSQKPPGSVLTVELEIGGQPLTALNGGPVFTPNPSISFFVQVETAAEVDRIYAALADGGAALMELGGYPWSERYAWVADRYGISWQVMATERAKTATIVPCLMFVGPQHGRAQEAMEHYTRVFPGGKIESIDRYTAEEAMPGTKGMEGAVKHGRFVIDGQELVAMDSGHAHAFNFNEAISLQLMCEDQAEIDKYWDELIEGGGEPSVCGWLKDRFGVSWQVVPKAMAAWMTSQDKAARDRAFRTMLGMKKLDVAALEAAMRGG